MNMTLDLYIDYLICSTSHTTATGLSRITNNEITHDKVTRFLSKREMSGKDLWLNAKRPYKAIENESGVLILDDSISEKPYTDENEIIAWHHDHKENRSIKGINFISSFYASDEGNIPIGVNVVKKDIKYLDKTGKVKRKASVSKHEHFRDLINNAIVNDVKFKYILNDVWFTSTENLNFTKNSCKKEAIVAFKANRLVALTEEDKTLGKFVRIDSLELEENKLVRLKGVDFQIRLVRQVFKNGDGSTGVLYLGSTDLEITKEQILAIYKKRWKVEVYHKSVKYNASLSKSPTKTVKTQLNHLIASMCAYIKLECIGRSIATNHFQLKQTIYLAGLKEAIKKLTEITGKANLIAVNNNYAIA